MWGQCHGGSHLQKAVAAHQAKLTLMQQCAHLHAPPPASADAEQLKALAGAEQNLVAFVSSNKMYDSHTHGFTLFKDSMCSVADGLLGMSFFTCPSFHMAGSHVYGCGNAYTLVAALSVEEGWSELEILHGLHSTLLQAGRHPEVQHIIACSEGLGALLNAGLLIAFERRLLACTGVSAIQPDAIHHVIGMLSIL